MNNLFELRKETLFFYSPFNFIRTISLNTHLDIVSTQIGSYSNEGGKYIVESGDNRFEFIYCRLDWDSQFFNLNTYRLYTVLFDPNRPTGLTAAISNFFEFLKKEKGCQYIFIEIPSEDITLIQSLGEAKAKLVETRLTYYNDKVQNYTSPERFKVKNATPENIENLRRVAAVMQNKYDRFHADKIFNPLIADSFLSKYVEEAIKGFSDIVLIPDGHSIPSDSFLTANYLDKYWKNLGVKVGKMVLSAVSSETNRGWYAKLVSEMTWLFKEKEIEIAFMNTQSTNRAVINVWERLGYKFAMCNHIISKSL